MNKQELRKEYLEKRRQLQSENKRKMDLEIQSRLLMTDEYRSSETVLIYVSKENEIDTKGIINAAFANKKRVAVPVTNDDYSLSFYYINSLKELKIGKFAVLEPPVESQRVTDFENSVCVIPSLCCDLSGVRVGYGKGCYDRFLSDYCGQKICLCYADCVLPSVHCDEYDVRMDIIVSDKFVKRT